MARSEGYLDDSMTKANRSKRELRDLIRKSSGSDIEWQKIQAKLYTVGLEKAVLYEGVTEFLKGASERSWAVHIISHKTEHAKYDSTKTSLRAAAIKWLSARGLFQRKSTGLTREQVYFASTRLEKIKLIRQLNCSHFIDDLLEVFGEAEFPVGVEKILFRPGIVDNHRIEMDGIKVFRSWKEISAYFFG